MAMTLKKRAGGLVLALWLWAVGAGAGEPPGNFVLVVNAGNDVTTISRKDAELIFLNKQRSWPDGKNISVVINENPKIYDSFSHTVLRRSSQQFTVFRKQMLFRGQGMPPTTLKTDKDVVAFVGEHVGSISYVSPDTVTMAVKVVSILQ
jgi:ABC-type phosphate transport system substrate-binding protein